MTDDQLLRFLVEVVVLVVAARIGGEIAARLRLPLHVGELAMGIVLGPSLLGWAWPPGFDALFPADAVTRSLLDVVSWLGVILLVLLAGLETRLGVCAPRRPAAVGGAGRGRRAQRPGGQALEGGDRPRDLCVIPSHPQTRRRLVIAAIGLSLGVLDEPMYATIVLIAVLTTVMAAPLLQICVRRAGVAPADEPTPAAPTRPVA